MAALLAALSLLATCADGVVCPAIGWSNALTVELAEGWADVPGGSITLDCSSPCGAIDLDAHEPASELSVPLTGGAAVVQLLATPDSVTATVLGSDGVVLGGTTAHLDWRRVGGSEECGGPMEAVVSIPS
jgi:hypothetical protein